MSLFTRDHEVEDPDVERTVRIARQRFVRRQWARRWLAWRRVVVAVLLLAVVVGSLWLVFFSSALAVQGVKVEGTQVLDPRRRSRPSTSTRSRSAWRVSPPWTASTCPAPGRTPCAST